MKALIAFDKFKNSMSAKEACDAALAGLQEAIPDCEATSAPITDGGEGFCEILAEAVGGKIETVHTQDACSRSCSAKLAWVRGKHIPKTAQALLNWGAPEHVAIIEMAQASGLASLHGDLRDPWQTNTYGTGEQIRHAIENGADAILLGLGGSATNDIGMGALQALGFSMLDHENKELAAPLSPSSFHEVKQIACESTLKAPPIRIACDVNNPLLGPEGATRVFGPQKGLRPEDFNLMENAIRQTAERLCDVFGKDRTIMEAEGTGAAGGIALGLMLATNAQTVPGFELVQRWMNLEQAVKTSDCILSGEGCFDRSSLAGKGPSSLIKMGQLSKKKVYIFAGQVDKDASSELKDLESLQFTAITPKTSDLETALRDAPENLKHAVFSTFSQTINEHGS